MKNNTNKKPEGLALPEGAKPGPNCGVTAMAIAAGISFDSAWDILEKIHTNRRGGLLSNIKTKNNMFSKKIKFTGGTYDNERREAYRKIGLKYKKFITKEICNIAKFATKNKYAYNLNLKQFVEWGAVKNKTYIVTTTHHVQVVKDGWVIDQGGPKHIDEFNGKLKHVNEILEVTKIRKASKNNKYENKVFYAKDINMKNPRKEKTFGYHSMEIILNNPGRDYEFYIKQGGRSNDLAWDIKKGNVVVREKGAGNGGYFKCK